MNKSRAELPWNPVTNLSFWDLYPSESMENISGPTSEFFSSTQDDSGPQIYRHIYTITEDQKQIRATEILVEFLLQIQRFKCKIELIWGKRNQE